VIDGSKNITPEEFLSANKLCSHYAANIKKISQFGVIQSGQQSKIEWSLASDIHLKKLEDIVQLGGESDLLVALALCRTEISLSRHPDNEKLIGIIGANSCSNDAVLAAHKLRREFQATIFTCGEKNISTMKLASLGCCFDRKDDAQIVKLMNTDLIRELSVQLSAEILYPNDIPLKLGEEAQLSVEIENVGRVPIPAKYVIIFKQNAYFKEKIFTIPEEISLGGCLTITPILTTKVKNSKSTWDNQILALPEVLEISVHDPNYHAIYCDVSGFFLNHDSNPGHHRRGNHSATHMQFTMATSITNVISGESD